MSERYLVGWHPIGKESDTETHEFRWIRDAQVFLRNELAWLAGDEPNRAVSDQALAAAIQVERNPQTTSWRFQVNGFVYWMRPEFGSGGNEAGSL